MPTSFSVANQTDLNNAIAQIDIGGASAATNTAYTITLTSSFTLGTDLFAVNLASGSSLTVHGNNATIDGGGNQRGFFVYSGAVAIDNLTITNAAAVGGAGGTANGAGVQSAGGGAGGMGAGGALFVASGGNVTQQRHGRRWRGRRDRSRSCTDPWRRWGRVGRKR
jgi:hypothetical protein